MLIPLMAYIVWWVMHIIGCLRRKDYRAVDKLFWFIILLVPVVGLILYRALGPEFYKHKIEYPNK